MGFGGSVSGMLASLKQNKRDRKSRFDKKGLDIKTPENVPFVDHKKLSPEDELRLKAQIHLGSKKHFRKVLLYTSVAILILFAIIWWLFVDSGRPLI